MVQPIKMNANVLTGHIFLVISLCYGVHGHIPSHTAAYSILKSLIYLSLAVFYYVYR